MTVKYLESILASILSTFMVKMTVGRWQFGENSQEGTDRVSQQSFSLFNWAGSLLGKTGTGLEP